MVGLAEGFLTMDRTFLLNLRRWFAVALDFAFGDPGPGRRLQPPSVGVQPFHDDPRRTHA